MEIAKNTTELNKKNLVKFQDMEMWKKSWIVGVLALAVIALAFSIENGQIVLRSIPFLVVGACVYPAYIILLKTIFYRQNKNFKPTKLEYTFTESKVLVKGESAVAKEETELAYSSIVKVKETKSFIYLYINKVSALVVDKSRFEIGSSEKVINLIKYKTSKKI